MVMLVAGNTEVAPVPNVDTMNIGATETAFGQRESA